MAVVQRVATISLHFVAFCCRCQPTFLGTFWVFVANLKSRTEPEGVERSRWAWHGQLNPYTPPPLDTHTHTRSRGNRVQNHVANFCGLRKVENFCQALKTPSLPSLPSLPRNSLTGAIIVFGGNFFSTPLQSPIKYGQLRFRRNLRANLLKSWELGKYISFWIL